MQDYIDTISLTPPREECLGKVVVFRTPPTRKLVGIVPYNNIKLFSFYEVYDGGSGEAFFTRGYGFANGDDLSPRIESGCNLVSFGNLQIKDGYRFLEVEPNVVIQDYHVLHHVFRNVTRLSKNNVGPFLDAQAAYAIQKKQFLDAQAADSTPEKGFLDAQAAYPTPEKQFLPESIRQDWEFDMRDVAKNIDLGGRVRILLGPVAEVLEKQVA